MASRTAYWRKITTGVRVDWHVHVRPVGLSWGSLGASASLHKEACAGLRTYLRYNEIYCHTYVTHRFDCFLFNTGLRWQRVKVLGVTQHLWSQGGEGATLHVHWNSVIIKYPGRYLYCCQCHPWPQGHCESSLVSCDECRTARQAAADPQTN